jgi:hypothetical protein
MGAFAERMLEIKMPMQRYRVTFKGISVVLNTTSRGSALVMARVKFLAMYTESTPDEGLANFDTFKLFADVKPIGTRYYKEAERELTRN